MLPDNPVFTPLRVALLVEQVDVVEAHGDVTVELVWSSVPNQLETLQIPEINLVQNNRKR